MEWAKAAQNGDPLSYEFPQTQVSGLDYSFSGIKTAVLYYLRDAVKADNEFIQNHLSDLCASVQHTLIQMLLRKLQTAAKMFDISQIAIAGGVSANSGLRQGFNELAQTLNWQTYVPEFQYCTDNAAMIAITAHYKYLKGQFADLDVGPDPRMKI
jgi:N6-L-threonylcarbamoyladenine synthase